MVRARVVSGSFFGLLQENVSLVTIEVATYLCVFLLLLHIHSSGKRNATMFAAALVHVTLVHLLFFQDTRYHAQALVMLIPERLPVYYVLMQAQLYYMAFVGTSRLRIDPFIQPFAMGTLVVCLAFPFELLGAKFLWWTTHDSDPLLGDRFYGVPVHMLFYYFFVSFSFVAVHHILRSYLLKGEYYEEDHWKREWMYVVLMPLFSTLLAVICLILFYHAFVDLLKVHRPVWFGFWITISLLFCWMADREKDDPSIEAALDPVDAYDSDWLYFVIDHAINQMIFVYSAILALLILLIHPADLISLSHHQPLGNCFEEESFHSLMGKLHHRKKYLCVHEFDEEFNLCNYPLAQLHYEDSWYMICGRGYNAYPTYVALTLGSLFLLNLLFFQILKRPKRTRQVSFQKKYH